MRTGTSLDGYIDAYCERLDPGFWAEPVNALTNAAFVLAALWMWPKVKGNGAARALCAILGVIGIGSFLFHTYAQVWSAIADVVPIITFACLYVILANRDYLRLSITAQIAAFAGFALLCALSAIMMGRVPVIAVSAAYTGLPIMLLMYGAIMRKSHRNTGLGLLGAGCLLTLSIIARSIDASLCGIWPLGTHFLWHLFNAALLGWLIQIYHAHTLASSARFG